MAKRWHPDRNQGSRQSEEKFKEILKAYQVLSHPIQKRDYDRNYKEELARDEYAPKKKKDSGWKSADSYKTRVDNLWQQYENLKKDKTRAFGGGPAPKPEKFYYFNNERISEEEFRAKTRAHYGKPKGEPEAPQSPEIHIYRAYPTAAMWERLFRMENMVVLMGGFFFYAVTFTLYPPSWWFLFTLLLIPCLCLGVSWLPPIFNFTGFEIEIQDNRIISRDAHQTEKILYFEELAYVEEKSSGMFLHRELGEPHITNFRTSQDGPAPDYIFIPSFTQNFEWIRSFVFALQPEPIH